MTNPQAVSDAYIKKTAEFAHPILTHLRNQVHAVCPDVKERIKWGHLHFDYKNAPLCYMAGFKQHCGFGFWKATLMKDPLLLKNAQAESAMGHFGKLTSLKDLPSDKKIIAYLKEAIKLNDEGIKIVKEKKVEKPLPGTPPALSAALQKNKMALKHFDAFSNACKREYITWITEARTEETRTKRVSQTIEWLSEGKKRNWKYE